MLLEVVVIVFFTKDEEDEVEEVDDDDAVSVVETEVGVLGYRSPLWLLWPGNDTKSIEYNG